jgi:hypothetical protein
MHAEVSRWLQAEPVFVLSDGVVTLRAPGDCEDCGICGYCMQRGGAPGFSSGEPAAQAEPGQLPPKGLPCKHCGSTNTVHGYTRQEGACEIVYRCKVRSWNCCNPTQGGADVTSTCAGRGLRAILGGRPLAQRAASRCAHRARCAPCISRTAAPRDV